MLRTAGLNLICGCAAAILFAVPSWADSSDGPADVPTPDAGGARPAAPSPDFSERHWYNTLPFIPVPEIGQDPDSGTTLGVLPVWLITDDEHRIRRIIAPDLLYNPNFGAGFHGRIYDYPSEDNQWSLIAGLKQRVEREFNGEYTLGRLREHRWSLTGSVVYDRDGAPRFFGIGNGTPERDESNYTSQQEVLQAQVGLNLTHEWQLLYTARLRSVDVLRGTLDKVPSIEQLFGNVRLGTNYEQLNRLSIIYDTRDSLTAPRRGMQWVAYGGVASRSGLFNDSLYSEAGIDGRMFWPINPETVLASHVSLRYLPSVSHDLPFWALSSLGGAQVDIGGEQPLRGFGDGRFYDRNSFSASVELRRTAFTFYAISHVEIEVAPFVDVGDVFRDGTTFPIKALHKVGGVGFRGIARPSVVGYVDIGYGSDGTAVFTGINYPF